jgi:hypothetical protein
MKLVCLAVRAALICDDRRESGESNRASGFLLSLISRVWHRELCGGFREATERRLILEDVQPTAFRKVVGLACCAGGGHAITTTGLGEVVELALLADRYEVVAVRDVLEAAAVRCLTVHSCAPLLDARSSGASLAALSAAARAYALSNFEDLARTDGFMALGEEALGALLEADELQAASEERVFEALVAWMTLTPLPPFSPPPALPAPAARDPPPPDAAGPAPLSADAPPPADVPPPPWSSVPATPLRGERLLAAVRFPLMDGAYLARVARGRLAAESLDGLVLEACAVKHVPLDERDALVLRYLHPSALTPRAPLSPPRAEVRPRGRVSNERRRRFPRAAPRRAGAATPP